MQQSCKNKKEIYNKIRESNFKLTKLNRAIIEILCLKKCLISKKELITKLKKRNLKPNRSTIYRQLKKLGKMGIIKKFFILENDYYEINLDHHHHVICINCFSIYNFYSGICKDEIKKIKKLNFKVIDDSFEIYGRCNKCLNQIKK